jgi:cobalt-precorrin 5A hydrolase
MKIAVLALTDEGRRLARRVAGLYPGQVDLYFKEGYAVIGRERSFASLSQLVGDLCKTYDGLIFVMAVGIVVRVISPFVRHKSLDPAVVVVDEGGNYSISLLSGHLGGANRLAHQIAELIGAAPVITTATDVQGRPAIDMVAKKLGLAIEHFDNLKYINGAIVNGGMVGIYTDMPQFVLFGRCAELDTDGIRIMPLADYPRGREHFDAVVVITDRIITLTDGPPAVFLRPQVLTIGIGCRRGVMSSEILSAVRKSCAAAGRSAAAVKNFATAWLKADEEGILQAAEEMRVPVQTLAKEALEEVILKYGLPISKYVTEQIGVGAVCEPAAILGAAQGELILAKQNYAGITVAIARESCPW